MKTHITILITLSMLTSGCSVCLPNSKAAPDIDTFVALGSLGAAGGMGGYVAEHPEMDNSDAKTGVAVAGVLLGVGVLYGISSIYGHTR